MDVAGPGWEITPHRERHVDRIAFMRSIAYEQLGAEVSPKRRSGRGCALSVNISSAGMCVLMDRELFVDQVLRIALPTPSPEVTIPTLADVRWTRRLPRSKGRPLNIYFVGLRYLLF